MYSIDTIGSLKQEVFWEKMGKLVEKRLEDYAPLLKDIANDLTLNKNYLTSKEVCEKLKISRQTLNNWVRKNKYKNCKINKGGRVLYDLKQFEHLIINENKDKNLAEGFL